MDEEAKFTRRAILIGAGATTATTAGMFALLPATNREKFPPADQVVALEFNVKAASIDQ